MEEKSHRSTVSKSYTNNLARYEILIAFLITVIGESSLAFSY